MTWSAALAEMAEAQASAFGETVGYSDATERVVSLEVRAVFGGEVTQTDVGYGVLADAVDLLIPEADLADPVRGVFPARDTARVVRYPAEIASGLAETWEAIPGSVRRSGGAWLMRVFRPVYRTVTV